MLKIMEEKKKKKGKYHYLYPIMIMSNFAYSFFSTINNKANNIKIQY